ncbi:MAG: 2-hydroxyacid dehydrogenase [Armatimonadota bacterium]
MMHLRQFWVPSGFGRIGLAVARRAPGFQARVLHHDLESRKQPAAEIEAEFVDLQVLPRESDFVTLHCPLTEQTRHLIGARELSLRGPHSFLIHTSRGPVADQAALYLAFMSGVIHGAALDVTEEEPIPPASLLLSLPKVVITPHIASASHATRRNMATMAAENLVAGLRGRPSPHWANPEVARK